MWLAYRQYHCSNEFETNPPVLFTHAQGRRTHLKVGGPGFEGHFSNEKGHLKIFFEGGVGGGASQKIFILFYMIRLSISHALQIVPNRSWHPDIFYSINSRRNNNLFLLNYKPKYYLLTTDMSGERFLLEFP